MYSVSSRSSEMAAVGELLVLRDEAANTQVELSPARGAIATSFSVHGRELLYLDPATLADPSKNVRGGNPVLFPSPGRLKDDRFARDGRTGAMKQHGFARNRVWRCVERATEGAASVTLTLRDDAETRAQFPWPFELSLRYSLRGESLTIDIALHNGGDSPLPFALGFHPYFRVADKRSTTVDTAATTVFDNVEKVVKPFAGCDLTVPELDVYLLDHGRTESALTLADGSRINVRASSEFTQWVVWTVAGKEYVCLEPWTAMFDALNSGEGLLYVAPQAVHRGRVEFVWLEPG